MFKKLFILVFFMLLRGVVLLAQYDLNHFYYSGRQFLSDGKYSKAIESFNILSRLDSSNYESYFYRGIAKYNLGDFNGALSDFDRTIHFNPVYTPAYHYRGIAFSRLGDFERALDDIQEAISLRPNFIGFYFSRGVTYLMSRQFEAAIKDFNKYIRKVPEEADAYIDRGACYVFMGDTLKAMNDFEKAISVNSSDPEGYLRRSSLYAMNGHLDEAISDLNTAIKLDTSNTFAYFNRALLQYEKGKFGNALADLNRVLTDEPGNALTLYNRALILSNLGDYGNALDDYDRVININPDNVLAYFNRASVFTRLGRYKDAQADYSRAIELYPDFAQAYMNRSYVRNMLGMYKQSKADYQTARKKIDEYHRLTADSTGRAAFADTAKKYDALLSFDADFAKKDFDNELIQHREVDIKLKPLFKFTLADNVVSGNSLELKYEDASLDAFLSGLPVKASFGTGGGQAAVPDAVIKEAEALPEKGGAPELLFSKALAESASKQYNAAMLLYDKAIAADGNNPYYLINRSALQADMISFISSIDNGVQVLSLDDTNTNHIRMRNDGMIQYDYTPALKDMLEAFEIDSGSPYVNYNLGNLYCLSNNLPEAIAHYTRAIELAPMIGESYFNRGLVQIFLKDRDRGCADLSVAGELGVNDAYAVIKKYCKKEDH